MIQRLLSAVAVAGPRNSFYLRLMTRLWRRRLNRTRRREDGNRRAILLKWRSSILQMLSSKWHLHLPKVRQRNDVNRREHPKPPRRPNLQTTRRTLGKARRLLRTPNYHPNSRSPRSQAMHGPLAKGRRAINHQLYPHPRSEDPLVSVAKPLLCLRMSFLLLRSRLLVARASKMRGSRNFYPPPMLRETQGPHLKMISLETRRRRQNNPWKSPRSFH